MILIWDSDTIPLKPLSFIDNSGKLLHYTGKEHHTPYFDLIFKLLGMKKIVNYSFVAQCFAIRGSWAHEFFDFVESRHQKPWMEAIISQIDFEQISGFSEYETLGTYLAHTRAGEIRNVSGKWHRLGNSLLGNAANLDAKQVMKLSSKFDFMAFESWDRQADDKSRPGRERLQRFTTRLRNFF